MNLLYSFLLAVFILLLPESGQAQYYYRLECDISIKNKVEGGDGALIMGRAYYDKSRNQLVYDIRFPEREVWVIKDTVLYVHIDDQLTHKQNIDQYNQSTVFHKILEGQLNNYGLQGSIFSIKSILRDDDMVITTWVPRSGAEQLGTVLTSTVNDALHGVVFKNYEDQIIGRQLFRDYTVVSGLKIPTEIIQVFYRDTQEEYQVFSFSNIRINNPGNEHMYAYPATGR
jgi:hypothetical protein